MAAAGDRGAPPGFAGPATLFMGARLLNIGVGLAMIPVLIHSLGGGGFATWALLLSCSAVFNELHLGLRAALVREVAANRFDVRAVDRLWSSALASLAAIYAGVLPLVAVAARPFGEWLRLPDVGTWHPGTAIAAVFVVVGARAVLMTGTDSLFASGRFGRAALLALGQASASNTAATVIAWRSRDLASTLVGFWAAQLVVVAAGFVLARRVGWRPHPRLVTVDQVRRLLAYGMRVQLTEWAQTINFQFDKFVIVRVLGLWPAALYEVSNRSVLALRSIPASGMDTFLPVALQQDGGAASAHGKARRMALLALFGGLVFFAAPLSVAPVFLFAWVGEMGYVSRHVFAWLALGAAANLLALPVATLAQAAGRADVLARAASASILVNVPLSLLLVRVWGVEGAALSSSVAMALGTAALLHEGRKALGVRLVSAITGALVRHWPLVGVCLVWGIAVHVGFGRWFHGMGPEVRYGLDRRAFAAVAAVALYAGCLIAMLIVKVMVVGLARDERDMLTRFRAIARIHRHGAAPGLPEEAVKSDRGGDPRSPEPNGSA